MDDTIGRKTKDGDELLNEQIGLLGIRRREIESLLAKGRKVDEPLIDDLAGIVLVLRAALLKDETAGHGREELETYELEARDLFSTSLRHRH